MAGQKRAFPYYTPVPEIDLKRRGVEGVNPGEEAAPVRVFEQPRLGSTPAAGATDFHSWTDDQLKEFLDQRGEDHDDCSTRPQLIQRARECEYATGPAKKPVDSSQGAEEDPLDAFMAEMQQLEAKQAEAEAGQPSKKPRKAELREEEDNVADFMEARARQAAPGPVVLPGGSGDSDEEVYATERALAAAEGAPDDEAAPSRSIGPLAPLDHDSIAYQPFAKDFYTPLPAVAALTPAQVAAKRRQLGIRVSGFDAPAPVDSFEQLRLGPALMAVIKKAGYEKPTAIQAQALPAALSGRDILGIAKTGSGKTAAFVIPMSVHIQDQPELGKGEGPIGVIVAPTRELAEQIHREARRFGRPFGFRVAAGIGGLSKLEQFKDLKAGADAAVCTPGRLIDLVKMKACSLFRTTFLVFDEADRMFDMGFEPQVRSIIGQVRPDRQTMLFSATMPTKVERLVRDALSSPVRVTVGEVVEVVEDKAKLAWLLGKLPQFVDEGEVLVFAGQIAKVEEVVERLKAAGHRCVAIHGDMDQHSRAAALREFSAGRQHVLVATDVAARGLDIKSLKTVVNLDAARDIDTHVHRVGRTGRAGDRDGTAWTLLDPRESRFAGVLLNSMVAANQEISPALQQLALKDPRFRKGQSRNKAGGQFSAAGAKRRQQVGGAGIGFGPSRDDPLSELYGDREGFGKPAAAPGPAAAAQAAPAGFVTAASNLGEPARPPAPTQPPAAAPQQAPAVQPAGAAATPEPAAAEAPGAGGVFGGQGLRGIMQSRFRNQFVTSGTTGGDIGAKATIIAPKQPRQAAAAQPPSGAMPSFLAKKAQAQEEQAQQAIAAAKAIAARLAAGGPGAAQQSAAPQPPQPPQQLAPAPSQRRPAGLLPPGMGASAGAYPDLSRDDGGSIKDSLAEERAAARSSSSSYREPQRPGQGSGFSSGGQPPPYQAVYGSRPAAPTSAAPSNGASQPYAQYGAAQPQQPPQQQPQQPPQQPPQPYTHYGATQPVQPPQPQPYSQYAAAQPQPPQPPPQPYAQYGAAQPAQAQPAQQPYAQYGAAPPPWLQPAQQPYAQYAAAQPAQPQQQPYAQGGGAQAAPQPAQPASSGAGSASVQASIAAAQAIAARLSAQAGQQQQQAPPAGPGRLGGLGSAAPTNAGDSVQASIAAARAVAARFAARDGGASQLSSQQPSNTGQWAWGRG